jgi:hypothetical protein
VRDTGVLTCHHFTEGVLSYARVRVSGVCWCEVSASNGRPVSHLRWVWRLTLHRPQLLTTVPAQQSPSSRDGAGEGRAEEEVSGGGREIEVGGGGRTWTCAQR